MAGIIAQLNAANRRRKNRKFAEVPNEKSVYLLPPFSSGAFSPTRHNKWMVQVLSTSVQAQDTSCLVYTCTDSSKVKLSVFWWVVVVVVVDCLLAGHHLVIGVGALSDLHLSINIKYIHP